MSNKKGKLIQVAQEGIWLEPKKFNINSLNFKPVSNTDGKVYSDNPNMLE